MKTVSVILCAAVIIAGVVTQILSYVGGRLGMPLAVGGLPAQLIPVLLQLLCLFALVILLVLNRTRRANAVILAVGLLIAGLCFLGGCAVKPVSVFREGFKHRIQHTISPEELRELARVARSQIPVDGWLPGPAKWSLWTEEEHRKPWDVLTNRTALGKLDPRVVVAIRDDAVELSWGGALVGHWGLLIRDVPPKERPPRQDRYDWTERQYDMSPNEPQTRKGAADVGDIAPDISTFIGG